MDAKETTVVDLTGRCALVTGASSGIGAAIAQALGMAGASVLLVGRDRDRLAAVEKQTKEAGAGLASSFGIDVTDADAPQRLVDEAVNTLGALNIIVHSAGAYWPKAFADTSVADLDGQWNLNVRAPFLLTQAALPHLAPNGAVVFISSMFGAVGATDAAAYCATKGAIDSLTRALCGELAHTGIRVNSIAPGAIETPDNAERRRNKAHADKFAAATPARRWGLPVDIAPLACFLVSDHAKYIHGTTIAVDGGWTAM